MGPTMLVLILGTGLFLMIGLRLMPLLRLGCGFRMLWSGRRDQGAGNIIPVQRSDDLAVGDHRYQQHRERRHRDCHRRSGHAVLDVVYGVGGHDHQIC